MSRVRGPVLPVHPKRNREAFASRLVEWFASVMRPFPWREDADPYRVWISEIMLQQTQAGRGVAYFNAWMRRFPDISSVAAAREEEVLAAWEGLGYYSRAKNIVKAARRIADEHGGEFPRSPGAVRALPGVGEYTAGAILSIAFGLPEPAVDANVLRIFARLLDLDAPTSAPRTKALVTGEVRRIVPADAPGRFNQALMELGALVCGKKPKCGECPVGEFCAARRNGTVAGRPARQAGKKYAVLETVAGIVEADGRIFIRRRPPGGLWPGLWEFPGGAIGPGESPEAAVVRHVSPAVRAPADIIGKIAVVRHGYTANRVVLHGFRCRAARTGSGPPEPDGCAWATPEELVLYAFPAGHRKLLEALGWKRPGNRIVRHDANRYNPP